MDIRMKNYNEINEAFVAGVGFGGHPGFEVGYMTKGIRENYKLFMNRFEERRCDISIPVRDQGYSVTVFPANETCMMVIASKISTEGKVDRRNHAFCHGFVVSNRRFSRDILPYLDSMKFDEQIFEGPAEKVKINSDEDILFKTIDGSENSCKEKAREDQNGENSAGDLEISKYQNAGRKRLFFFAIKTILKEGHYIIDCGGECTARNFQFTLYDMLPPPLRYQLESCSCGEYRRMFNVLFKCSKPYKTAQSYKQADFTSILSDEYLEYEVKYPEVFKLVSGEDEVRESYYDYMEEHVSKSLLRSEKSIKVIFDELEKSAREYLGIDQTENGDLKTISEDIPMSEQDFEKEHDFSDVFETETDMLHVMEDQVAQEAVELIDDKRLSNLIDGYIKTGTYEYFRQLKNALFGACVGDMLRNEQRKRMRSFLERRDARYMLKDEQNNRYFLLIMLSYELTADEYWHQVLRHDGEEVKFGPYDYTEIKSFIRTNTAHSGKIFAVYKKKVMPL